MGGGSWTTSDYDAREAARKRAGKSAFDHSDRVIRSGRIKVHDDLNPHGIAAREARKSGEHPKIKAIAVHFDVTGSMQVVPQILQQKLPELMSVLIRGKYCDDPQIMFGAIGDATCDRAPLQIGQFESDNRMDECLGNLVLEGGGGGHITESYELAMYFMARHTAIDGGKGYYFIIGDEAPYDFVKSDEVRAIIGDSLESDIPIEKIIADLKKKFNVFYIMPGGTSHAGEDQILRIWKKLLGQNVIELSDPANVCEAIAMTIGICEGRTDIGRASRDLIEAGSDASAVKDASRALAPIGLTSAIKNAVPNAARALIGGSDKPDGAKRL